MKGELGFDGIVISYWAGIDQLPGDYARDVRTAIYAGIDMVIVVGGSHINNLGYQMGGWSISWQGSSGSTTIGATRCRQSRQP